MKPQLKLADDDESSAGKDPQFAYTLSRGLDASSL